jgi:hypothetical protein
MAEVGLIAFFKKKNLAIDNRRREKLAIVQLMSGIFHTDKTAAVSCLLDISMAWL